MKLRNITGTYVPVSCYAVAARPGHPAVFAGGLFAGGCGWWTVHAYWLGDDRVLGNVYTQVAGLDVSLDSEGFEAGDVVSDVAGVLEGGAFGVLDSVSGRTLEDDGAVHVEDASVFGVV